jgi:hypothetical protein
LRADATDNLDAVTPVVLEPIDGAALTILRPFDAPALAARDDAVPAGPTLHAVDVPLA